VADLRDAIHGFHFADTVSLKFLSAFKSPGLGPTRHTFRRVADEALKAETALPGSVLHESLRGDVINAKCLLIIVNQTHKNYV